jgi:hypothetical protein
LGFIMAFSAITSQSASGNEPPNSFTMPGIGAMKRSAIAVRRNATITLGANPSGSAKQLNCVTVILKTCSFFRPVSHVTLPYPLLSREVR